MIEPRKRRRLAIVVGVLFLVAVVAGQATAFLSQSLRDSSDRIDLLPGHATELAWAALFICVMGAAGVGTSVAFYPILRQRNANLAIGSIAFRAAEAVMCIACAATLLLIGDLSQVPVGAAAPDWDGNGAGPLIDLFNQLYLFGLLAFGIGAVCYSCALFRSRILPRWLSGQGLFASVLWTGGISWAIVAHGQEVTLSQMPLLLNELVLAAWLISRGFGSPRPALASSPALAVPSPAHAAGRLEPGPSPVGDMA